MLKNRCHVVFAIAALAIAVGLPIGSQAGPEAENWFEKGVAHLRAHRYDEAIEAFTQTIEVVPHDYQAYGKRGAARYLKGDHAGAIADYRKALAIHPNDARAMHQLALVRAYCPDKRFRNPKRAAILARKAAQRLRTPTTLATLAAIFAETGDYAKAAAIQEERIAMVRSRGQTAGLAAMQKRLAQYRQKSSPGPVAPLPPAFREGKPSLPSRTATKSPGRTRQARQTFFPFTVHVHSFREGDKANRAAQRLRADGENAFACPVDIPGKGRWHRVYAGAFETERAAREKAEALRQKGLPYGREMRRPWTVAVSFPVARSAPEQTEAQLTAKGYLAYRILGAQRNKRLVFGAFKTKKSADIAAGKLLRDGFGAFVEKR